MTWARAADEDGLPLVPSPEGPEPGLVRTLADESFRISAEITSVRMAPQGNEIFAAHDNGSMISVVDAATGRTKSRIPLLGQAFDLSSDGRLVAGIREDLADGHLKRPFGIWKWPERTALWTSDNLGLPGASRFSPDGKLLAVLGSMPGRRTGQQVVVFDTASGREAWRADAPEADYPFARGLAWLDNDLLLAALPNAAGGGLSLYRASSGKALDVSSGPLGNASQRATLATAAKAPLLAVYDSTGFQILKRNKSWELEPILDGSSDDPENSSRLFKSLEFSPDGKWLVAATPSGSRIYDLEKRELFRRLSFGAESVQFSGDGKTLISAQGSVISVMGTDDWKQKLPADSPACPQPISALMFSPDGKLLASRESAQILLWDWSTGKVKARILAPNRQCGFMDMTFHPQAPLLVAGDGLEVFWWDYTLVPENRSGLAQDAADPARKRMLKMEIPSPINEHHLLFDKTGSRLLFASKRFAGIAELAADPHDKPKSLSPLKLGAFDEYEYIREVALEADGKHALIAADHRLRRVELATGETKGDWKMSAYGRDGQVTAFSPDAKRFVKAGKAGTEDLEILDTTSGAVEKTLPFRDEKNPGPFGIMLDWKAWSRDSSRLACTAYGNLPAWTGFTVRNVDSDELERTQLTRHGRISAITFSPDGKRMATANVDGTIQIWDLEKSAAEKK